MKTLTLKYYLFIEKKPIINPLGIYLLQIFPLLVDNEPSLKKRGKKKENCFMKPNQKYLQGQAIGNWKNRINNIK